MCQVVSTQPLFTQTRRKNVMQHAGNPSSRPIVPSSPASMARFSSATSESPPTATRYSNGSPARGATEVLAYPGVVPDIATGIVLKPPAAHSPVRAIRRSAGTDVRAHRRLPERTERHSISLQALPIRWILGSHVARALSLTQLMRVKSGRTYDSLSLWNTSSDGDSTGVASALTAQPSPRLRGEAVPDGDRRSVLPSTDAARRLPTPRGAG